MTPKTYILTVLLLILISWPIFLSITLADYKSSYNQYNKVLKQKQEENKKYWYIQTILEDYHDYLSKYRSINSPDTISFSTEIKTLILNGVLVSKVEISTESEENIMTLDWVAPNMRTIDLQVKVFNTFNQLYGGFKEDITLINVDNKDWVFSFSITWRIDWEKIKQRIFSNDIDWDWVEDFTSLEVKNNTTGISQNTMVLNDQCPFTPFFNITISNLIKNNTDLVNVFPYYKEKSLNWYYELEQNWCLKKWDITIK